MSTHDTFAQSLRTSARPAAAQVNKRGPAASSSSSATSSSLSSSSSQPSSSTTSSTTSTTVEQAPPLVQDEFAALAAQHRTSFVPTSMLTSDSSSSSSSSSAALDTATATSHNDEDVDDEEELKHRDGHDDVMRSIAHKLQSSPELSSRLYAQQYLHTPGRHQLPQQLPFTFAPPPQGQQLPQYSSQQAEWMHQLLQQNQQLQSVLERERKERQVEQLRMKVELEAMKSTLRAQLSAEQAMPTLSANVKDESSSSRSRSQSGDVDAAQMLHGMRSQAKSAYPPRQPSTVSAAFLFKHPSTAAQMLKQETEMNAPMYSSSAASTTEWMPSSAGVLKDIWDQLDEQTRFTIVATGTSEKMNSDTLLKREKDVIDRMKKFDGNPVNAPSYFSELIVRFGQYPFKPEHCIRIMIGTMVSAAQSWITGTVYALGMVPKDVIIPAILGKFKEHYLGSKQASYWRKQLQSMSLNASADKYITLAELEVHYASFIKILNNLRVCDRQTDERDAISYYIDTLPQFIYQYLGEEHRKKSTLEEVHRAATGAIRLVPTAKPPTSTSKQTVELNGINSANNNNGNNQQAQTKNKCFHCGSSNHILFDCNVFKSNKPQTGYGKKAFAEYLESVGKDYEYDPVRLIQAYQARHGSSSSNSSSSSTTSDANNNNKPKFNNKKKSQASSSSTTQLASYTTKTVGNNSSTAATAPTVNNSSITVTVVDTWTDGDDDNIEDMDSIQLIHLNYSLIEQVTKDENKIGTSLCVRIEMNGIEAGYALVDQGANRTLIRRTALEKFKLLSHICLCPVSRFFAVSASGHHIPINLRFMANMTIAGEQYNDQAVVYVVDNTTDNDIGCDIVLGRHTIAHSRYRLIDTLKGTLCMFNQPQVYVKCAVAKTVLDANGSRCIMADDKFTENVNVALIEAQPLTDNDALLSISVTEEVVEEVQPRKRRRPRKASTRATASRCS